MSTQINDLVYKDAKTYGSTRFGLHNGLNLSCQQCPHGGEGGVEALVHALGKPGLRWSAVLLWTLLDHDAFVIQRIYHIASLAYAEIVTHNSHTTEGRTIAGLRAHGAAGLADLVGPALHRRGRRLG